MVPKPSQTMWRFFAALAVVAFALNWLWEMVQMSAYTEMAWRSWRETMLRCTLATLGDAAITFTVYGVGALHIYTCKPPFIPSLLNSYMSSMVILLVNQYDASRGPRHN